MEEDIMTSNTDNTATDTTTAPAGTAVTEKKPLSTAALVLGVLSIVFAILFALLGLILGIAGTIVSLVKRGTCRTKLPLILSIIGVLAAIINMTAAIAMQMM